MLSEGQLNDMNRVEAVERMRTLSAITVVKGGLHGIAQEHEQT